MLLHCPAAYPEKFGPDVEYVPTPEKVVAAMLTMAGITKNDVLYDLGCGDGRFVITAAKRYGARGVGVDLDPSLIRLSNSNAHKAGVGGLVRFIQGDLFEINLGKATAVSLYLTNELNVRLRPKLFRELRAGTRIVSHDFDMGDWKPDTIGRLPKVTYHYPDITYVRDAVFYYWLIPAQVSGTWRWTVPAPAGAGDHTLRLVQKFQEISGDLRVKNRLYPIRDARLAGDRISFRVDDAAGGKESTTQFAGQVNGDAIRGSLTISGVSAGKYRWIAKRSK